MSNYGAGLIGIQITPTMYQYMARLIDLGILEGPIGNQKINAALMPLVDAVHQILAGGAATVTVTKPGNPQVVAELANLVKDSTDAANEINKKVGFYLTIVS